MGPPKPSVPSRRKYRTNAPRPGRAAVAPEAVSCRVSALSLSPGTGTAAPVALVSVTCRSPGRVSGKRGSGGFAAQQGGPPVVFVDAVEDRARDGQDLGVVADHRQAAQGHVEAGCLGCVVAFVVQVGFMDDGGDPPQHRIGQVVAAQDRLEAALPVVVTQFHAAHVKRSGTSGDLGRVGDEHELSGRVDVAAYQPGAGGPVDMDSPAGSPLHTCSSVRPAPAWSRRSWTAARAWSRSAGGK